MVEIEKNERYFSLITLEGLRDWKSRNVSFTIDFEIVGHGPHTMPQYHMRIEQGGKKYVLVAARFGKGGPNVRVLNLFPAVISMHREFGVDEELSLPVPPSSTSE